MYQVIRDDHTPVWGYYYRLRSNGDWLIVDQKPLGSGDYSAVAEMPLSVYYTIVEETKYNTEEPEWLHNLAHGRA